MNHSHKSSQCYTRSDRVAALIGGEHVLRRFLQHLVWRDHRGVLVLCSFVVVFVAGMVTHAWRSPFPYHLGMVPDRNIDAVVAFSCESAIELEKSQDRARTTIQHVYSHNPQTLTNLRRSLVSLLSVVLRSHTIEGIEDSGAGVWRELYPASANTEEAEQARFTALKESLANDEGLENTSEKLCELLQPFEATGLLRELDFGPHEGSQDRIRVYSVSQTPSEAAEAPVVRVSDCLRDKYQLEKAIEVACADNAALCEVLQSWLLPRLTATLKKDAEATRLETQRVLEGVPPVRIQYAVGQVLTEAEKPINAETLMLLRREYEQGLHEQRWHDAVLRFAAFCVFFTTLMALGWLLILRWERRRPRTLLAILTLHAAMLLTVVCMVPLISVPTGVTHAEILPLLLFAQWLAIMFSWGFSLVMTLMVLFLTVHTTMLDSDVVMVMACTTLVVCIQLDRLRSRGRLVKVGFIGGLVASGLMLTLGLMDGQPLNSVLLTHAALYFVWVVAAGFVMTGLLPLMEQTFGILTDMSLLDLGNGSHPLLQELIRRAPATYNHSMQVATIAEAAVKTIHARELLTRVGACFHDIGKVFKPEYFSENQCSGENIHNSLEPRISALVLVAHIKDGADLARQHRLPAALVDLIEQHHGTSLVSYFYGVANRHNREHGATIPLEEASFRYPGPKPQTKEAAVLMLADAAESACRSLDNATPHRIESMIRQVTKMKLDDGQFDECGLTLRELHSVENSIITSIIAIKHGRIKYPGQEP